MNRRQLLATGVTLSIGSLLHAQSTQKQTLKTLTQAYGTQHAIQALKFDPSKLRGISQNVIVSHHDNNYAGAVKKLNLIQKQILSLPKEAHPIEYGALKKEELIAMNSKLYHELYFDNLGGSGKMTAKIETIIKKSFGTISAWQNDFIKTAQSLSGGSGWVILSYIKEAGVLMNQIAADHSQSLATGVPILVMDMYEHSYHMDYGTKAAKYIDAFMDNIDWKMVTSRWEIL